MNDTAERTAVTDSEPEIPPKPLIVYEPVNGVVGNALPPVPDWPTVMDANGIPGSAAKAASPDCVNRKRSPLIELPVYTGVSAPTMALVSVLAAAVFVPSVNALPEVSVRLTKKLKSPETSIVNAAEEEPMVPVPNVSGLSTAELVYVSVKAFVAVVLNNLFDLLGSTVALKRFAVAAAMLIELINVATVFVAPEVSNAKPPLVEPEAVKVIVSPTVSREESSRLTPLTEQVDWNVVEAPGGARNFNALDDLSKIPH